MVHVAGVLMLPVVRVWKHATSCMIPNKFDYLLRFKNLVKLVVATKQENIAIIKSNFPLDFLGNVSEIELLGYNRSQIQCAFFFDMYRT